MAIEDLTDVYAGDIYEMRDKDGKRIGLYEVETVCKKPSIKLKRVIPHNSAYVDNPPKEIFGQVGSEKMELLYKMWRAE